MPEDVLAEVEARRRGAHGATRGRNDELGVAEDDGERPERGDHEAGPAPAEEDGVAERTEDGDVVVDSHPEQVEQ